MIFFWNLIWNVFHGSQLAIISITSLLKLRTSPHIRFQIQLPFLFLFYMWQSEWNDTCWLDNLIRGVLVSNHVDNTRIVRILFHWNSILTIVVFVIIAIITKNVLLLLLIFQDINPPHSNMTSDTLKPVIPPFLPPPSFDLDSPSRPWRGLGGRSKTTMTGIDSSSTLVSIH